jgi:putative transposase
LNGTPRLQQQRVLHVIGEQLRRAIQRGVRILQYSIQLDHLHLMVEGSDASSLARGMQWLFSRIAQEVNRVTQRSGRLFRDRHFRRALTTATAVRRVLVYVMMNGRKHLAKRGAWLTGLFDHLDECSSMVWFERWHPRDRPPEDAVASARAGPLPPPARPSSWLARSGWLSAGGPIRFGEAPACKLL